MRGYFPSFVFMSVRPFPPDISFHLGGPGPMQAGDDFKTIRLFPRNNGI